MSRIRSERGGRKKKKKRWKVLESKGQIESPRT